MKRMKQAFVPVPNNKVRVIIKDRAGTQYVYQTTTKAEWEMISALVGYQDKKNIIAEVNS